MHAQVILYTPFCINRRMIFDTSKNGLLTLFKPYQAMMLEHIWELNKDERVGVTSGTAYKHIQDTPEKKSRASVIFSLNDMVDDGILDYEEESGKGGYHRVYYPAMTREEFAKYVHKTIKEKLENTFP